MGRIGGFEFAPRVKYRKPTVALRKCSVPRPFVEKISCRGSLVPGSAPGNEATAEEVGS